jgi:hypothetical protein
VHPVQVTEGAVAEALQAAELVVQATMTEPVTAVTMAVAVTKPVPAVAEPKAAAMTMASSVTETTPQAVAAAMTKAKPAEEPATVPAGRVATGQGRGELRRAERGVKVVTSVPPLAEPQTVAESQARPETAVSQARPEAHSMTTVTVAKAVASVVPHPVTMTTVTESVTRAVQVATGPVKGTLELGSRAVKVAGGTGKPRAVILGIVAVRNRRGVVEVAGLKITGVGHTGNRVGPGGEIRNETTRRGIAGQGAKQRDSQSQSSPMSDTHGQSLVNMASLPPGVVRNRARRASPRRPVRGRRHPPTKPLATGASVRVDWPSPRNSYGSGEAESTGAGRAS